MSAKNESSPFNRLNLMFIPSLYIEDDIGRPELAKPRAPMLYDTDALSISLLKHLDHIGIRPWTQLAELRRNADKSVLAVDGVISIVESPGYRGWMPDPNLVKIDVLDKSKTATYWPPNWQDEWREKYILEEGAIDRDKVFVDKWDPPILDRGGKLRLVFGTSKYRDNRALEEILNLNRVKPEKESEEKYEWTNFKWKPANECKQVFRWRDSRLVDLRREYLKNTISFWEYLPNMVIVTPVVICSDEKVVFIRRGDRVKYYPGYWSISLEEQIDPTQDMLEETLLQRATERAIEEEIGVKKVKQIKILSLYREWHNGNVNIAMLVYVDETSGSIENAWRGHAVDQAEFQQMRFEPFMDLDIMIAILQNPTYEGRRFHPGSKYRLLMALLAEHSFDTVLRKLHETPTSRVVR